VSKLDELTPNQRRRALRLLERAEAVDAERAESERQYAEREARVTAAKEAKQVEADAMTARFAALGLPFVAQVHWNSWSNGVPDCHIWVTGKELDGYRREHKAQAVWLAMLDRLEAAERVLASQAK
jgi:hypothetical protein